MKENELDNLTIDENGNLNIKINGEKIVISKDLNDALACHFNDRTALKVRDVLYRLIDIAKEYRLKSVPRINALQHMNDMGGEFHVTQKEIDAILTDFINVIAADDCVNLGLYTKDLQKER